MGKYIRKRKIDGESSVALMDVSPSSLGVLTRAKSLALQQLRHQKPSCSSSSSSHNPLSKQKQQINDCGGGGSSYLQLRSRRLQKKPPIVVIRSSKRRKQQWKKDTQGRNPNPNNSPNNFDSIRRSSLGGDGSDSVAQSVGKEKELIGEFNRDPCVETSFGENFLDLQATQSFDRTTSESTPCSFISKPEIITTLGSSTKLNICISESNQREESFSGSHRHLPTTPEMDEFFSGAEEEQQKRFIEKYNFDPVTEQPLPGRFEWTKVDN